MLFCLILCRLSLQLIILHFKIYLWRQDSSLVAVVDSVEPGGTGFESRCGRNLSLVHIYAETQTVQIHGIIMSTERINDPPIKKRTKKRMTNMSKVTCKRSIKPFKKTFVLAENWLLQKNEII